MRKRKQALEQMMIITLLSFSVKQTYTDPNQVIGVSSKFSGFANAGLLIQFISIYYFKGNVACLTTYNVTRVQIMWAQIP